MRTSVKVIRFTLIVSAIFALLTYVISLIMAYGWFEIPWLSNNFLITIFGGAFASMLVVLVCEMQKYILIKRETENQIFYYAGLVCGNLLLMHLGVQKRLDNKTAAIDDYYTKSVPDTNNAINILKNIDYTSFSKNNKLQTALFEMNKWLTQDVFFVLNDANMIKIAINNDKIHNLKEYKYEGTITSQSPNTNKVLMIFESKLAPIVKTMDKYMYDIDKLCNGRYCWELRKMSIVKNCWDVSEDYFDDYINQNSEKKN